jgi:hypothetical protein
LFDLHVAPRAASYLDACAVSPVAELHTYFKINTKAAHKIGVFFVSAGFAITDSNTWSARIVYDGKS